MCFKRSLHFGWGGARLCTLTPPFPLRWRGARLCYRVVGPLWRWWCESVCALRACWWGRAFVSGSHCGEESSDVMSPVSEVWAFVLCSLSLASKIKTSIVSFTHPETMGNLCHVHVTQPFNRFLLCYIYHQLLITLSRHCTVTEESWMRTWMFYLSGEKATLSIK